VIVLGIDPGTASTGYGVIRGDNIGFVSLIECGVIRTRAREPLPSRLLDIFEMPPAEIKKAVVGTGNATKEQVQFMLTRLLRLKSVPQPSDAADGVAAALACLASSRVPTLARDRTRLPV